MLTFSLLSAIAIFIPYDWQVSMGIANWIAKNLVWEWILFLFGAVWFAISAIQEGWKQFSILQILWNLPNDYKEVLGFYAKNNVRAHPWIFSQPAPRALESEGLLLSLPERKLSPLNQAKAEGILYYRIRPWVFRYLRKRPELYS